MFSALVFDCCSLFSYVFQLNDFKIGARLVQITQQTNKRKKKIIDNKKEKKQFNGFDNEEDDKSLSLAVPDAINTRKINSIRLENWHNNRSFLFQYIFLFFFFN